MGRFMIQASHTPEECLDILDEYVKAGAHYLTHTEWGCDENVHTGWIVVEAESDAEARLMVPPIIRNKALLVRLTTYSPEQIKKFHEKYGT
jgi:hypothetical protein